MEPSWQAAPARPTPDLATAVERTVTSRWWLPVCALLGILLRLALVAKLGGAMTFYDEGDYDRIGQSLAHGQGFSNGGAATAFRPPGEPLYLAAVYLLFGHRIVLAELLQALLLAVVPFAVARFGRRHGLGPAWANVAGGVAALHPGLAYASATLYPVALTAAAIALGLMWSAEAIAAERGGAQAALAGLCLGIAGAATTTFVPLGALAALVVWRGRQSGKSGKWRTAAILAAVALAPAVGWMGRNAVVLGAPVLATNGSYNMALGANDEATPRSGNWIEVTLPPGVGDSELARDQAFRDRAVGWIRTHPGRYALLVGGRILATFDSVGRPKTRGTHDSLAARAVGYSLFPWMLLSLVGLVLDRRRPTTWLVAASIVCVALAEALTITKPRFRFPCDPMLAVLAAGACRQLWASWQSRKAPRPVS